MNDDADDVDRRKFKDEEKLARRRRQRRMLEEQQERERGKDQEFEQKQKQQRRAVLELMAEGGIGIYYSDEEIADLISIEITSDEIDEACRVLRNKGLIQHSGMGTPEKPFDCFNSGFGISERGVDVLAGVREVDY